MLSDDIVKDNKALNLIVGLTKIVSIIIIITVFHLIYTNINNAEEFVCLHALISGPTSQIKKFFFTCDSIIIDYLTVATILRSWAKTKKTLSEMGYNSVVERCVAT